MWRYILIIAIVTAVIIGFYFGPSQFAGIKVELQKAPTITPTIYLGLTPTTAPTVTPTSTPTPIPTETSVIPTPTQKVTILEDGRIKIEAEGKQPIYVFRAPDKRSDILYKSQCDKDKCDPVVTVINK